MTASLTAATLLLLSGTAYGQDPQRPRAPGAPPPVSRTADSVRATIPFFSLGESPLALRGDVRPGVFVSAVGRRAIAMGTEDGRFELWSWPIKWLHDMELFFRIPKYVEPIPGHTIARTMVQRPEGVTFEYACIAGVNDLPDQADALGPGSVPIDEEQAGMAPEHDCLDLLRLAEHQEGEFVGRRPVTDERGHRAIVRRIEENRRASPHPKPLLRVYPKLIWEPRSAKPAEGA